MAGHYHYPHFNTTTPQTKGITRPTAQRLSLSLAVAPLMTQRSLLFRVQTELSQEGVEDYGQISAKSDYSSLQLLSAIPSGSDGSATPADGVHGAGAVPGQARPHANNMSPLVSAASVYSQTSLPSPTSGTSSPSYVASNLKGPRLDIAAIAPRAHTPEFQGGREEFRRYAMAFSPSMDLRELERELCDPNGVLSPSVKRLWDLWEAAGGPGGVSVSQLHESEHCDEGEIQEHLSGGSKSDATTAASNYQALTKGASNNLALGGELKADSIRSRLRAHSTSSTSNTLFPRVIQHLHWDEHDKPVDSHQPAADAATSIILSTAHPPLPPSNSIQEQRKNKLKKRLTHGRSMSSLKGAGVAAEMAPLIPLLTEDDRVAFRIRTPSPALLPPPIAESHDVASISGETSHVDDLPEEPQLPPAMRPHKAPLTGANPSFPLVIRHLHWDEHERPIQSPESQDSKATLAHSMDALVGVEATNKLTSTDRASKLKKRATMSSSSTSSSTSKQKRKSLRKALARLTIQPGPFVLGTSGVVGSGNGVLPQRLRRTKSQIVSPVANTTFSDVAPLELPKLPDLPPFSSTLMGDVMQVQENGPPIWEKFKTRTSSLDGGGENENFTSVGQPILPGQVERSYSVTTRPRPRLVESTTTLPLPPSLPPPPPQPVHQPPSPTSIDVAHMQPHPHPSSHGVLAESQRPTRAPFPPPPLLIPSPTVQQAQTPAPPTLTKKKGRQRRRYVSSPAILSFRPSDLPMAPNTPPPPLPDLKKKLAELSFVGDAR